MSYSKVCDGCENHCNLDPGEKPCKDTEARKFTEKIRCQTGI